VVDRSAGDCDTDQTADEEPTMNTPTPAVTVTAFDHLVLRCADVETTLRWYIDELGLAPVRIDEWRAGRAPFPSIRVNAETIIDLVPGPQPDGRLDHICLVVEPTDLAAVAASGRFEVVDGPGPRFGARGDGTSLYIRDPDGTTVELRHY
jgi:catechol 2,3-dioxygenase-like lactoylglutathione lyase family enzyme